MYETPVLVAAMLVVFLGAGLQGSVGFGYAVLSVPLLTLLDPRFVPVAPQIIAFFLSVAALMRERGGVDTAGVGWIIVGRIPGAVAAAAVLAVVMDRTLDLLIGSIVLVTVLLLATGITVPLNTLTRIGAGVFSGFSGTASAIGGPPIALLYRDQTGPTVRSTLGTIFAIGIVINLVVLTVAGILGPDDLKTAALLAPASFVGFAASSLLHRRVEGAVLRNGILIVATISAIGLLVRAALG